MEKKAHKPGSFSRSKPRRLFLVFSGICLLALPLIILRAPSTEPELKTADLIEPPVYKSKTMYKYFDQMPAAYMEGSSSERTLDEYYSRRQYLGAPPLIPHEIKAADEKGCLTCHEKGGWAKEFKRFTPITPHPENTACRQCHVKPVSDALFVENDWQTLPPPLLGRSHLPGSPPPVPHSLQMRENCIPCHVGPGTVTPIRSEHPMRGNCRQCHVPETTNIFFERPVARN